MSHKPTSIAVRQVVIHARSAIDARRLADALGPALERAFAAPLDHAQPASVPRGNAERVSGEVRAAVAARLEKQS